MAHDWKVYQYLAEVLVESDGSVRVTQLDLEYVLDQVDRNTRISQAIIEYILDQLDRFVHVTQLIIEVAYKPGHGTTSGYLDEMSEGNFAW